MSLGVYFLIQDIHSLLSQKKSLFENSVRSASILIPLPTLKGALATKDSQSPSDSQLLEALKGIRTDLNLNGNLHILRQKGEKIEVVTSTDSGLRKGESFNSSKAAVLGLQSDLVLASDLQRSGGGFWMLASGPLKDESGLSIAYFAIDSIENSFAYQLVGYLLHYLFLALGMTAIAVIAMSFSQSGLKLQTEKMKEALDALFENATEAILLISPSGQILQMNSHAAEIFEDGTDWLNLLKSADDFKKPFKWQSQDKKVTRYFNVSLTELEKNQSRLLILTDSTKEYVNQSLQNQLIIDPLTKTLNKAYLQHFLDPKNLQWVQNEGCSMLVIDIDDFKSVNDTKGHALGDLVLQNVGTFLKSFFRKTDKVIRFGGDEFVILLPGTHLKEAARIAQNFIESFRKSPMEQNLLLTASVGVAQLDLKESGKDWLERADAAMYEAKHSGKNSFRTQIESLEILN